MLREMVKWDYELRNGAQLETVIDRALSSRRARRKGPVYLSLPREVLAEKLDGFIFDSPSRRASVAAPGADEGAVEAAAAILSKAKRPVIITASTGRDAEAVAALGAFRRAFRDPRRRAPPAAFVAVGRASLPSRLRPDALRQGSRRDPGAGDGCAVGADPGPAAGRVPGHPSRVDPLCARYPIRGFPCDVAIAAASRLALPKLGAAVKVGEGVVAERRQALAERRNAQRRLDEAARGDGGADARSIRAWISHCLSRGARRHFDLVNEYTLLPEHCPSTEPGSLFRVEPGGGARLGRRRGARRQARRPDRQVISILGDGSYIFANPVAVHHAGADA